MLNAWTESARAADVRAVTDALFSIVERTVYHQYPVIEDSAVARELVVVVRDNLALRIHLQDVEKFHLVFVGSPVTALELRRTPAADAQTGGN
ncbi:hypothetical protein BLA60_01775 [Actinophytocola xinjiangensis]|uniref:Uncharacterized protein n=1 Tax=Actinophytocola xinjiangensis TaxID=485602 RepID=A0A7Z0WSJ0_9PSEU|nr:hypothetical protein BLA60_01775 [Actinophytocola xinjiangensis]